MKEIVLEIREKSHKIKHAQVLFSNYKITLSGAVYIVLCLLPVLRQTCEMSVLLLSMTTQGEIGGKVCTCIASIDFINEPKKVVFETVEYSPLNHTHVLLIKTALGRQQN